MKTLKMLLALLNDTPLCVSKFFVVDVVVLPDRILRTTYQCVRGGTSTAISSNRAEEKNLDAHDTLTSFPLGICSKSKS